jgi:hypothetical protein
VRRVNNDCWNEMSISQRIVRAAWIAVGEHLAPRDDEHDAAPACGCADQASSLRRLVALDRLALLTGGDDR